MAMPIEDGVSLWQDQAKCKTGYINDTFFENEKAAKKICAACPVIGECLEYALIYNCSGIWGGTTDKERRRIPAAKLEFLIGDYMESGLYNPMLKS